MDVVTFQNVFFSYGQFPVLKDIHFTIEKGDFIAVTGDNGTGKSTLVKLLLGELQPNKGQIFIFGEKVSEFKDWKRVGYLSQSDPNRNFPVTVQELLEMNLYSFSPFLKPKFKDKDKFVQEAIEVVDLENVAHKRINKLSGGQMRRALIACALVTKPDLLVLDEPMAGLDITSQKSIAALLSKLNKERDLTVIVVTHGLYELEKSVSKIFHLEKMKLQVVDAECLNS